ncbi:MAG TPA: threonine/serine dehydratase [Candidatus Thermoplasmatota archaeon]|nr:threonine/serine dehydratase [Candidatus Thermoplasmatota archaeon]
MLVAQDLQVTLADIQAARERIKGVAWRTPLVPAGRHEDGKTYLKLECLQRTGSFKVRGAWNRMSGASDADRRRGFVTVSAGNHGQAVAWSAKRLGSPCTVWVPDTAVQRKVDAIRALGATVKTMPHDQIMASMTDDRWSKDPQVYIHPFGDRLVMAGQGTIGLEILEDLPDVKTIIVPVGGGGLSVGIATAVKALKPTVKVYGVQAANAAPLARSWETGKPERVPTPKTIADGIAASIVFDYMFPLLRRVLDGVFTVSEDELRAATSELVGEAHVVAEPAGASSLAAARQQVRALAMPVACVVSGGNIAPSLLAEVTGATR